MDFADDFRPLHVLSRTFHIAACDCLTGLRASLPSLTDILQEIAGLHADALGVGIQSLQAEGFTWMLGRLSLRIAALPSWKDAVRVTTWPSGVRGRLLAERQFVMEDESGKRLLEASSEWLYVDFAAQRLARLPGHVAALARPGTLNLGLCAGRLPPMPAEPLLSGEASFPVRRAEIDTNLHVNNVHYTEWMLETLPEALFFNGTPTAFDIEYKQAARLGDTVTSRTAPLGDGGYAHTVTRADGTLLARAHSVWAAAARP